MVGSPTALTSVSISCADWEWRLASALVTVDVCACVATASNDCWSANWRSCAVMNASSPPKSLSATGPVTLLAGVPLRHRVVERAGQERAVEDRALLRRLVLGHGQRAQRAHVVAQLDVAAADGDVVIQREQDREDARVALDDLDRVSLASAFWSA